MTLTQLQLPIFNQLREAERILIAGAGGGFDLFSGLPLYFALKAEGKEVFLGSLSFSNLRLASGEWMTPTLLEVTADSRGSEDYFPERRLSEWFREKEEDVPVYCFERTGVRPLAEAYHVLTSRLHLDTVILVDGGTDSLMFGDEADLGTPEEDISSVLAVSQLKIPRAILSCVGFGVDYFHGICHAQFLENVAELIRADGYLGTFSLTEEMPAVQQYRRVAEVVSAAMPSRYKSIVCSSIVSSIAGHYGDHHVNPRTKGSRLWINPLMAMVWSFHAKSVGQCIRYRTEALATETIEELCAVINHYRASITPRPWEGIPV